MLSFLNLLFAICINFKCFSILSINVGGMVEATSGDICFPEISTSVLEKVLQYLQYAWLHRNAKTPVPEYKVDPKSSLELLMASHYLDC